MKYTSIPLPGIVFLTPPRKSVRLLLGVLLLGGTASAQAPVVVSTSPGRNAVAAPRTSPVSIRFSQPLNSSPAVQQAVKVFSRQAGGKKAGTATVTGNTLTFTPNTSFKPGETVLTTVTTAAQNANNQNLAQPFVFQFTTATTPSAGIFTLGTDPLIGSTQGSVALGDVNGDGYLDLLTTNSTTATVSVRLNDGVGTFSGGSEISVAAGFTQQLVLGDVDNDGDLDLLSTNGSSVSVRVNNGQGSFSGTQQVAVGPSAYELVVGDVNGDGFLDLLTGNYPTGPGNVSVRLNDGTGTFGGTQQVTFTGRPTSIALGDIDSDGDLDFLTANASSSVTVSRNNGAGTFSSGELLSIGNPTDTYDSKVLVNDLDGDGDVDFVVVRAGLTTAPVYFNNGSGSFTSGQAVAVRKNDGSASAALGDVDGDQDLDLLIANVDANTVQVRLNNGSGVFSGGSEITVGTSPVDLMVGDVDGNGTLDLATANNGVTTASVRLNRTNVLASASRQVSEQVSLYPNPAHHAVSVRLPRELAQHSLQVRVVDALGRVVLTQQFTAQQAHEAEVVLSSLVPGAYTVRLLTSQGAVTKHLLVN